MKVQMIEVEISKIIIDEKRREQIIVLKEKGGGRQFPIVIGLLEASSIKMELSEIKPPRPMTHDLLVSCLEAVDAVVDRIIIDKMVKNTFHAKFKILTVEGKNKIIDARPSDGIAIAVRVGAPIFVKEEILEKAAIIF